jgi:hypothetical protein
MFQLEVVEAAFVALRGVGGGIDTVSWEERGEGEEET